MCQHLVQANRATNMAFVKHMVILAQVCTNQTGSKVLYLEMQL